MGSNLVMIQIIINKRTYILVRVIRCVNHVAVARQDRCMHADGEVNDRCKKMAQKYLENDFESWMGVRRGLEDGRPRVESRAVIF